VDKRACGRGYASRVPDLRPQDGASRSAPRQHDCTDQRQDRYNRYGERVRPHPSARCRRTVKAGTVGPTQTVGPKQKLHAASRPCRRAAAPTVRAAAPGPGRKPQERCTAPVVSGCSPRSRTHGPRVPGRASFFCAGPASGGTAYARPVSGGSTLALSIAISVHITARLNERGGAPEIGERAAGPPSVVDCSAAAGTHGMAR
jgi:hypothetical protein